MYKTAQTALDQPDRPQKTPYQRSLLTLSAVFAIVTVLFIVGSSALIFYAKVSYPAEISAQATTVTRSIVAAQAQATALSSPQHIYAQLTDKPPTYRFPLDNRVAGQAQGWATTTTSNTSCIFTKGAYHLHGVGDQTYIVCQNTALNDLSNFVLQVRMTIFSGFSGGIVVRSPYHSTGGYAFGLAPNGIYEADITTDTAASVSSFGRADINLGIGETNLLTAIAQGSHISFYVNKQFVTSINEGTYHSGSIGFMMSNLGKHTAGDVAFSNAQLWQL
jgi:hypothetical protein